MPRLLLCLLPLLAVVACADPCNCPLGQTCSEEGVCVGGCTTAADCPATTCAEDDVCCDPTPACVAGQCGPTPVPEAACGPDPITPDGWDDPPGSGRVYVVSAFAIGADPVVDVDARCEGDVCADNAFAPLGRVMNDQIRQSVLGGEGMLLVEVAGLDPEYAGFDRSVTIKIYAAHDADDPFFPANNFRVPPGHDTCCEFLVDPSALVEGQARQRLPARIRRGRLATVGGPHATISLHWGPRPILWEDDAPEIWALRAIPLERPQVQADLRDLDALEGALFSGVVPSRWLAETPNPWCRYAHPDACAEPLPQPSSLLDLTYLIAGQPDIDRDLDGLDCFHDLDGDGGIDQCCPAQGNGACPSRGCAVPVPPTRPDLPSSCAVDAAIRDGYSATFELRGVPARIVGVATF